MCISIAMSSCSSEGICMLPLATSIIAVKLLILMPWNLKMYSAYMARGTVSACHHHHCKSGVLNAICKYKLVSVQQLLEVVLIVTC